MAGGDQSDGAVFDWVEATLEAMIDHQARRRDALARRLDPEASRDDALNPQDRPALAVDPQFNYEDGTLTGLISARIALRREARRRGVPTRETVGNE